MACETAMLERNTMVRLTVADSHSLLIHAHGPLMCSTGDVSPSAEAYHGRTYEQISGRLQ